MSRSGVQLALDLGTTTLAGALIDEKGDVLARGKLRNPQGSLGSDVIRRLEAAGDGQGPELQRLIVEGIDLLVSQLCLDANLPPSAISRGAAAANSAVTHLLLGLEGKRLLFPPHRPQDCCGRFVSFGSLGGRIDFPLYIFPLISGFVGGDLVAFLFSRSSDSGCSLYIDVGTNAEMALCARGQWWTTSVAAGPAFEGGEIRCGMSASKGAIDRVRATPQGFELHSIGEGAPSGLCGSGLIEAISASLEAGLIDVGGQILSPLAIETNLSRLIVETPDERAIRLYLDAKHDILLGQRDLRQFQLAKAAVHAGVLCLLEKAGLEISSVDRLVMTGAFGFSLSLPALKRVAMVPESMLDRVLFVPDGALDGVSRFLVEAQGESLLQELSARLKPYPLSGTPAFEKAFLGTMGF